MAAHASIGFLSNLDLQADISLAGRDAHFRRFVLQV
jgi:hypothetical protein